MTNVNLVETLEVESSAITEVAYYPNVERLFVLFRNGRTYEYLNVPSHVMSGLREAPSKGKFLNKYVLAQYRFKKVQLLYTILAIATAELKDTVAC